MFRIIALIVALAPPAFGQCIGQNLIAALPAPERAALDAAVAAQPYPSGNFWQAERDGAHVVLVGTYHLDDPRLDASMTRIAPLIDAADTVLVEAGPQEEKTLVGNLAKNPALTTIVTGPTIPEQLSDADWNTLSAALRARGIPPFMAAKLQPWYLSMILGVAPCAMGKDAAALGLDKRIIAAATAAQKPVAALEPWDTILNLFSTMPPADQLDMIRMTLPMEKQSADYAVTLADSYFAGDARQMWEFLRLQTHRMAGYDAAKADAEFAEMERVLMAERNRDWIPVIETAAGRGPVLAAFGALHLAGKDGILALLEREGFRITPLPL